MFRAIARSTVERDYVLEMLLAHDGVDLDYDECIGVTYDDVRDDPDAALSTIVERYKAVEAQCDAVVIVGSDYTDVGSPTELGYNARIAANLGAPVLLVLGGRDRRRGAASSSGQADPRTARRDGADRRARPRRARGTTTPACSPWSPTGRTPTTLGEIVTGRSGRRAASRADQRVRDRAGLGDPRGPFLVAPSVRGVMRAIDGTLVTGDPELLTREALGVVVAGMSMVNVLPRLTESAIVVIPADRTEVLLAVLLANASGTFPSLAGIVLNGRFALPDEIDRLIDGLGSTLPIIATDLGTYETDRAHHEHPRASRRRLAAQVRHGARATSSATSTPRSLLGRSTSRARPSSRRSCSSTSSSTALARRSSASCCPRATTTACCAPRRPCSRAASPI